ncbi:MAG: aminotransferase class V-fold PLP-dependent enzyme [Candidatus Aenigmarchaeota archaeon]|nr:aminotransferase class V-fold PLP-dependent enzyme [Candidatus Aenigmarchaeota archaeon]NIQ18060.1 aminotransferase class V-fold PLP-dependent enzyme [Candidatus Aenigmarchaeota archaeon]
MRVYLDNAATTMTDQKVVKAMLPYFSEKFGNAASIHQFGKEAKKAVERARSIIAKKINADPSEIVFTSGGTESDNLALRGIAHANKHLGNHIITSKIEHPAILNTCNSLMEEGFEIKLLDVDNEGFVDLKALEKAITKKTILVSIMHANNEIGTVQPLDKIGQICKKHRVLFHTDAVQSFTKVPIDVKKMHVDLLSLSGHKIHGPKGIGALFVRKGVKLREEVTGGRHESGLRAGTENVPGIVGLGKAVDLTKETDIKKMKKLRDRLIGKLLKIKGSKLNGPKGNGRLCNNVNVGFRGVEGESLMMYLDTKGIASSTGSACSNLLVKEGGISHVLQAVCEDLEFASGSIRLTLSKFNTDEEIGYTIESIKEVVEHLRKISGFK